MQNALYTKGPHKTINMIPYHRLMASTKRRK